MPCSSQVKMCFHHNTNKAAAECLPEKLAASIVVYKGRLPPEITDLTPKEMSEKYTPPNSAARDLKTTL